MTKGIYHAATCYVVISMPKYLNPSILLFWTSTYPPALLYGLRIVALFDGFQFTKKMLLEFLIFKQGSILKFQDKICLEDILLAWKCLNKLSPSVFNTWFSFSSDLNNHETSSNPRITSENFRHIDMRSVTVTAVESLNKIEKIWYLTRFPLWRNGKQGFPYWRNRGGKGEGGGESPPTSPKFAHLPCLLGKLPHPSRLTPTKGSFHPTK